MRLIFIQLVGRLVGPRSTYRKTPPMVCRRRQIIKTRRCRLSDSRRGYKHMFAVWLSQASIFQARTASLPPEQLCHFFTLVSLEVGARNIPTLSTKIYKHTPRLANKPLRKIPSAQHTQDIIITSGEILQCPAIIVKALQPIASNEGMHAVCMQYAKKICLSSIN